MTTKSSLSNLYIGFDQSVSKTGVAVYKDGKILLSDIETDSKAGMGERLADIEKQVEPLLAVLQPRAVFYEYAFRVNESIKVWGLFEKMIAKQGLAQICFRSGAKEDKSWRKRIGVSSNKRELQDKLGLSPAGERPLTANRDASDAAGILSAGLLVYNEFAEFDEICRLPFIKSHVRDKDPHTILLEIDQL